MRKIFIIAASIVLGMPLHAQDVYDGDNQGQPSVEPIESSRLQGPREATEAEKEYARRLAEDRAQQQQIDQNLPMIDENAKKKIAIVRKCTAHGPSCAPRAVWVS